MPEQSHIGYRTRASGPPFSFLSHFVTMKVLEKPNSPPGEIPSQGAIDRVVLQRSKIIFDHPPISKPASDGFLQPGESPLSISFLDIG